MAIPTREEAIATLEGGRGALDAVFARLSDAQMTRPATIGGGDWSAKDLLGHIAFWEELALEALADWRAGRRPAVEAIFEGGAAEVDAANARNQERTARESLAEVRARAEAAHTALVHAVQTMADAEWRSRASYPTTRRRTLAELLGSVVGAPRRPFGHAFAHLPDLEAYAAAQSTDPPLE